MKAVIYARVSTGEQETDNQIDQLTSWALSRDWEVKAVYKENESAWKAGHQKELARLLDDARKRKFDTVLTWALDRLSREGPLAILTLVNRLQSYGVKVISYQESWTEAPGILGELLFAISGWVAQMESERRSDWTKAGLARAVSKGKRIGRPRVSERPEFSQRFADIAERISLGQLSRRQAARELSIGYTTLKRLLDAQVQPPDRVSRESLAIENPYAEVLH